MALVQSDGVAVFDVKPDGPRAWEIDAGLATVDVIGTRFTIERTDTYVTVSIERGRVRVRGLHVPGAVQRLGAGETLRVEAPAPSVAALPEQAAADAQEEPPEPSSAAPSAPSWRRSVERGQYGEAYDALQRTGFDREVTRAGDVATLLALADAARLSGHPTTAVAPLWRIVEEHPRDPRAAVAAFTLGPRP